MITLMHSLIRGTKAIQYIFYELLPSFLMGLLVFLCIILMFQVLRLTEFALVHGVDLLTIAEIIGFICISMLPALFPMSLLFAILMTYSRFSTDSEIVAMKASGLHMGVILSPALLMAALIAIISAQTSFEIAPWGNRQFEVLYSRLANTKAAATIKSGTFSEGFFDLVIYANDVDSDKGHLKKVFIYDERDPSTPITIISKTGDIVPDPQNPGHKVQLRLFDGDIHRKGKTHTKIKFNTYDLKLSDPIKLEDREKSGQSMTMTDLSTALKTPENLKAEELRLYQTEYHKRIAIAVLCLVFAMLGVGFGTNTNKRNQKAGGMILCIILIVAYWAIYITFEGFARSGYLPAAISIWVPNTLFALIGFRSLKKNWN